MNHTTLPATRTQFRSQIHKTFDFAAQVPIGNIPTILTPLAREDTLCRCVRGHGRDRRFANEWELASLVEPGSAANAGGEELALEGLVDYADDGAVVDDEADGDTEHWEEVRIVDGS